MANQTLNAAHVVEVDARSTPFHDDPPYAVGFHQAIGRVVILWGKFEFLLDAHLRTALNVAADRDGVLQEMTTSLTRKTRSLRGLYRDSATLQPQYRAMKAFLAEVERVSKDRNYLIHSAVIGFEDGDPPRIKLRNMQHKADLMTLRTLSPSLHDIGSLAGHIDRIHTTLLFSHFWKLVPLQKGFEEAHKAQSQDPPEADTKPPILG